MRKEISIVLVVAGLMIVFVVGHYFGYRSRTEDIRKVYQDGFQHGAKWVQEELTNGQ